ncbi:hypothetical protein BRAO375_3120009 [Bradyrhizobium sp. ORS 375]|nr:hypothetical protein BRAO375_3120009 [Bradyrhizobium sp. ORS 375]
MRSSSGSVGQRETYRAAAGSMRNCRFARARASSTLVEKPATATAPRKANSRVRAASSGTPPTEVSGATSATAGDAMTDAAVSAGAASLEAAASVMVDGRGGGAGCVCSVPDESGQRVATAESLATASAVSTTGAELNGSGPAGAIALDGAAAGAATAGNAATGGNTPDARAPALGTAGAVFMSSAD